MKKKIFLLLTVLFCLCAALTLIACGGTETPGGAETPGGDEGGDTPATPGHIHSFGEWIETTAPTCVAKGEETRTCTCGAEEKRDVAIDPDAHALASVTDWTSDETGHWHQCTRTGCTAQLDKATHTWGTWSVTTPATCMAKGEETRTCICGASETRSTDKDMTNHVVWSAWSVITPSTCVATGVETRVCVCGTLEIRDVAIDPDAHSYLSTLAHDATHHFYACACGSTKDRMPHVSSGAADASFSEVCIVCDYVITPAVGVLFKNATVQGTYVSITVPNSTTQFSFANEITTVGNAKYNVVKNVNDSIPVVSKVIDLAIGNNTAYVVVLIDGEAVKVYTVTIRRKPLYTVIFDTDGGSAVQSQIVEEGSCITPPAEPTKIGYAFAGWSYDLTQPVTGAVTLKANWTALSGIAYKVEYYQQNVNQNNYDLVETVPLTGTTDETVIAEQKTYPHFTLDTAKGKLSGTVAGNGGLVLQVYYTRNTYTVSVNNASVGKVTNTGTYAYGKQVTLSASSTYPGYTFVGYYVGEQLLSDKATDTLTVTGAIEARFDVAPEMANFYFTSTTTTCKVTGVKDATVKTLTVPGYVTAIDQGAFAECSALESITLPFVGATLNGTSNTHFGYIFGASSYDYNNDCVPASLKTVVITGGTRIDSEAFYKCSSLTTVNFGDNSQLTSIGEYAFYECRSLTTITIPASVTHIAYEAFYGCCKLIEVYNLSSLNIWAGSEDYGYVGYYAINVYTSTNVESKLFTDNNGYIFYDDGTNRYLMGYTGTDTALTLPASCKGNNYEIYKYAFRNRDDLTSVTIPASVTSIGNYAFRDCDNLTTITIPAGVTSIGACAFEDCSRLTTVTFSANSQLTSIGGSAFCNCSSLTTITIPASVTSIGNGAFSDCSRLTTVEFGANSQLTSIGHQAFYGCYNLTSITIPASVTSIYSSAFSSCSSLTTVNFGDNSQLTSIGSDAFQSCYNLTTITIPASVTSIGVYVFEYCYKLIEVYNLSSLNITTGSYIKNVYTPTSGESKLFTDSNGYIFYDDGTNRYLMGYTGTDTALTLPASCNGNNYDIYQYAFYGRDDLTSVAIPARVTSIGSYAFYDCDRLTTVEFDTNSQLTRIGERAFAYCDSLTTVEFGANSHLTSIGYGAFWNCSNLTTVTFGANSKLTSIGGSAFWNCSNLTTVYYGGSASDWRKITIGSDNYYLTSATRYYYSATEPTTAGNWWYYDQNGKPAVWP